MPTELRLHWIFAVFAVFEILNGLPGGPLDEVVDGGEQDQLAVDRVRAHGRPPRADAAATARIAELEEQVAALEQAEELRTRELDLERELEAARCADR